MKKIIGIMTLVVVVVGGIFSYNYYKDTYQSKDAYAVIKQEPKVTLEKDSNGNAVNDSNNRPIYSYDYKVVFVFKDGTTQTTDFSVISSAKNNAPYTVGQYVKGELSKTRVNKTSLVEKSQVPQSIVTKLE